MTKRKSKPTIGPVEFIDKVIRRDEKGEPFYPGAPISAACWKWRSGVIRPARLMFRLVVLSEPKKSGKTFIAAWLAL